MKMYNANIIILIPAYKPNEKLISMCNDLVKENYKEIVVVSDGNDETYLNIFNQLKNIGVSVLYHVANQGKGRTMKTGFNYICLKYKEELNNIGVLTIDADGQHTQSAVRACSETLKMNIEQKKWVFGCRNFDKCYDENRNIGKIPFRSKLGNETTKILLKLVYGLQLSDTQTGLRGFPGTILSELLKIEGERYEYEMNQILYSKEKGISLVEVPIETIYEHKNESSHFNPIVDSWKIYKPILKYTLSSSVSVLIEYLIFILLIMFTGELIISNYMARICSAGFNFYANKKFVFKSQGRYTVEIIKYVLLCFVSVNISTLIIYVLNNSFGLNVVVMKIAVDTILYFLNYIVQRKFIF